MITAFIEYIINFLKKCKKIFKKELTKILNSDILYLLAIIYIEC